MPDRALVTCLAASGLTSSACNAEYSFGHSRQQRRANSCSPWLTNWPSLLRSKIGFSFVLVSVSIPSSKLWRREVGEWMIGPPWMVFRPILDKIEVIFTTQRRKGAKTQKQHLASLRLCALALNLLVALELSFELLAHLLDGFTDFPAALAHFLLNVSLQAV